MRSRQHWKQQQQQLQALLPCTAGSAESSSSSCRRSRQAQQAVLGAAAAAAGALAVRSRQGRDQLAQQQAQPQASLPPAAGRAEVVSWSSSASRCSLSTWHAGETVAAALLLQRGEQLSMGRALDTKVCRKAAAACAAVLAGQQQRRALQYRKYARALQVMAAAAAMRQGC